MAADSSNNVAGNMLAAVAFAVAFEGPNKDTDKEEANPWEAFLEVA